MTNNREGTEQPGPKPRLSRSGRAMCPPPMRLMPRDEEILSTVAEYRVLRQDQIQRLFFGSKSTAQYRLSHLYQHGFLDRHFLPVQGGWSPTLYTLAKRGIEVLRVEYGKDIPQSTIRGRNTTPEFLEHTLAINDVRIAFTLACRIPGFTLVTWRGEAAMKMDYDRVDIRLPNGKRSAVSLIPDSYCVLQTPRGSAPFFIELDRGTETTQRFATKILAYRAYVEGGQYTRRYQSRSLRVLTITLSAKRLMNLKQATEQVGGTHLFWFAVLSDVITCSLFSDPMWWAAGADRSTALIPTKSGE
ncbi:MAG: replication-relaxation family protein [Aggregatilineales bacterium]